MSANNSLGVPSRIKNYSCLILDTFSTTGSVGGVSFVNKQLHTGSAFIYVNDAAYGAVISIGEDGVYSGAFTWEGQASSYAACAIVYNDPTFSQAAVSPAGLPNQYRLAFAACSSATVEPAPTASFCQPLPAGSKIYLAQTAAGAPTGVANVKFTITKLDY